MSRNMRGFHGNQFVPPQGTQTAREKVVAAPWQVAALKQLLRRAGGSPPKEEIVRTGKETGLEVRWIRNWLSRQRRGRAKSGDDEDSSINRKEENDTSATTASKQDISTSSHGSSESNVSIHQLLQIQLDGARQRKRKKQTDTASHSLELAAEPLASSETYLQIGKPGTSFSLPLSRAPQAQSTTSNTPSSAGSLQVDDNLKMRSLTQSPSLGYIPFAFPLAFSQMSDTEDSDPSLSGDTSLSSSGASSVDALAGSQALIGTQVSYPTMYSEHFVPTVPTLPPDHTQPNPADAESQRNSNMLYLSQLLLDATNAHVPQLASSPSGGSEYLSGLLPLSFAPSLQSHSTSVLGTVSTNPAGRRTDYMWYPPPPVAFKARVTDLALLTKRIRATYEENAGDSSVTGSVTEERGKSASNTSRQPYVKDDGVQGATAAVAAEDTDSDEEDEELLTPAGDLPAFIGNLDHAHHGTKATRKGKEVLYRNGVFARAA